jgi:hypothetical protein
VCATCSSARQLQCFYDTVAAVITHISVLASVKPSSMMTQEVSGVMYLRCTSSSSTDATVAGLRVASARSRAS